MARRRFIHPVIWQDDAVARLTRDERLLFVGLITIADDYGRLVATPAHLQGSIYPYDEEVTSKEIRDWRDGIASKCANVTLYRVNGKEYIAFKKWDEWQKPSHPAKSKLPPPSREGAEELRRAS